MLVDKITKGVIERDDKPNENWATDKAAYYLVDSNSEFAEKIRKNAPFYDFVIDDNGNLTDITPTERPPEPEPELSLEEKIAVQEETISTLTECILEMSEYVYQ